MVQMAMYKGIEVMILVVMFVMFYSFLPSKNDEKHNLFLWVDTTTENHSHDGNDRFPTWE